MGKMLWVDEVRRLGLQIREEPFDFVKQSIVRILSLFISPEPFKFHVTLRI